MQQFNMGKFFPYAWHFAAFIVIAIGTLLRFYGLDRESLWSDELFTVAAALDVGKNAHWLDFVPKVIPELTFEDSFLTWKASDNTPPLFELLLISWSKLFGTSDFSLRALPALLSSISLVVFYFGLKDIIGVKATLLGTILFSLSISSVTYAQEVRAYTLAAFFCTLALVRLAHHILNDINNTKKLWPDIIIFTLLAYSHYTGLYMAGLFAGIYLLMVSLPKRKIISDAAKFLIVPVVVLPWMYLSKKAFIFSSSGGYGWRAYHFSDITHLMIPETLNFYAPSVGPLLFLLIVSSLIVIAFREKNSIFNVSAILTYDYAQRRRIQLLILLLASLLLLFLYSVYNSFTSLMWHPRYFTVSLPVVFFIIATICSTLSFGKKTFIAIILFLFLYSAFKDFTVRSYPQKDQYREAAEFLASSAPNDSFIVLGGVANEAFYRHYLDKYAVTFNRTYVISSASDQIHIQNICQKISHRQENIFVFQHSTMSNFGDILMTCKNLKFIQKKQFRGVHIEQYKNLESI